MDNRNGGSDPRTDPFGLGDEPDEANELYDPERDLATIDQKDEEDEVDEAVAEASSGLSRRTLFRTGAAAGVLAAGAGSALLLPGEDAQAHGTIRTYPGIGGQRTRYEVSGSYSSFGYRPSFHDRMGSWMNFWLNNSPWGKPAVVWSYGVHTDHRESTAHNNGRGFDLSRIYPTFGDGKRRRRFFARRDIWQNYGRAARLRNRRWYWATAASAHHHFQNVITYLYNSAHNNHIHIDNLVSGGTNSSFDSGSTLQVQHVQACCRFIWGKNTTIDGIWGPQTRGHSTEVLRRIGRGSGTILGRANWLAFNRATMRKGYGVQNY